jgi:hypothetical protein
VGVADLGRSPYSGMAGRSIARKLPPVAPFDLELCPRSAGLDRISPSVSVSADFGGWGDGVCPVIGRKVAIRPKAQTTGTGSKPMGRLWPTWRPKSPALAEVMRPSPSGQTAGNPRGNDDDEGRPARQRTRSAQCGPAETLKDAKASELRRDGVEGESNERPGRGLIADTTVEAPGISVAQTDSPVPRRVGRIAQGTGARGPGGALLPECVGRQKNRALLTASDAADMQVRRAALTAWEYSTSGPWQFLRDAASISRDGRLMARFQLPSGGNPTPGATLIDGPTRRRAIVH